jgi:hypothetical protein
MSEHRRETRTAVLLKTQEFRADIRERSRRRPKISDPPWRDDFAPNDMLTPFFSALLNY